MSVFEITEEDFAEYDIDLTRPTLAALPAPVPAPKPEPKLTRRRPKAPVLSQEDIEEQARREEQIRKDQSRNLYLTELSAMNDAIDGLKERMPEVVKLAKSNGATWEDIGDAIGTSRQAACRHFNEKISV